MTHKCQPSGVPLTQRECHRGSDGEKLQVFLLGWPETQVSLQRFRVRGCIVGVTQHKKVLRSFMPKLCR